MTITANATFCATLVDQWARMGSTDAFIAPGSRSTPLALALLADQRFRSHLFLDERSASFACLGHGLATGRPAVLLCTSGTATTHFHGAVVEADASRVPMLVCTADRPPELWGIGAPQTIDQTDLFGEAVRGFLEPGPPDDPGAEPVHWRPMASDAWTAASGSDGGQPGPVHLNLSFRDPLVGEPGPLPPAIEARRPATTARSSAAPSSIEQPPIDIPQRGVIIAGRSNAEPEMVSALADATGWPILADPRSGCLGGERSVSRFDHLLRSAEFRARMRPDLVVRIGEPPASKALSQWITASASEGSDVIALTDGGQVIDPERVASAIVPVETTLPRILAAAEEQSPPAERFDIGWVEADRIVNATIDRLLSSEARSAGDRPSEPGIARSLTRGLAPGAHLVVSSSMPIRDIEWYGASRDDITVHANRGANGIDGVTSTAIGISLERHPTTVLIGDVAFLHDSNGLIGLRDRDVDLTIVVIDNDGGGIFSFLPQHDLLPHEDYEFLFGTPHGSDLSQLCRAHGVSAEPWSPDRLNQPGLRVLLARTDREHNREVHDRLVAAAVAAVEAALRDEAGPAPGGTGAA